MPNLEFSDMLLYHQTFTEKRNYAGLEKTSTARRKSFGNYLLTGDRQIPVRGVAFTILQPVFATQSQDLTIPGERRN